MRRVALITLGIITVFIIVLFLIFLSNKGEEEVVGPVAPDGTTFIVPTEPPPGARR